MSDDKTITFINPVAKESHDRMDELMNDLLPKIQEEERQKLLAFEKEWRKDQRFIAFTKWSLSFIAVAIVVYPVWFGYQLHTSKEEAIADCSNIEEMREQYSMLGTDVLRHYVNSETGKVTCGIMTIEEHRENMKNSIIFPRDRVILPYENSTQSAPWPSLGKSWPQNSSE